MTGFIGKNALQFVKELWELLLAAQKEKNGIPPAFLENKKLEMERKREEAAKINEELIRRHEQMMKDEFNRQVKDIATGHAQSQPPTVLAAAAASADSAGFSSAGGRMRGWDAAGGVEPVITVPQGFHDAEDNDEPLPRREVEARPRSTAGAAGTETVASGSTEGETEARVGAGVGHLRVQGTANAAEAEGATVIARGEADALDLGNDDREELEKGKLREASLFEGQAKTFEKEKWGVVVC
uniref:PWI domain-containing protein n=1 Tax=Toxoplasma gondii TgCATBr9 TaxID=943120 RepID=A0A2T6J2K3_TOXGO|nr:PWI domain-containing protein [Toxoplasma gondii TgCATBr9]